VKKILAALLFVVIAIQFIQPAHNTGTQILPSAFEKIFIVPPDVQAILTTSCYDCHSNHTVYPWYAHTQPIAWMLANHINEGKAVLNFSDFGSLGKHRQISKLRAIVSQVKDNEMPISSYALMHKKARLSGAEKTLFMNWMNHIADSLSSNQ
jgi:hypothetical protein